MKKRNRVKRRFSGALILASVAWCLAARSAGAEHSALEKAAEQSAAAWLELVDSGKYADSWAQAAELFKQQISEEQWEKAVKAARSPLGDLVSRHVKSSEVTRSLPGAPDGEYVVLQYDTEFKNKKSGAETVVPMRDKDGRWKVAGYFIR